MIKVTFGTIAFNFMNLTKFNCKNLFKDLKLG